MNQSHDVFMCLFDGRIKNLPENILSISFHLDISENEIPFVHLKRALSDSDGDMIPSGNGVLSTDERYFLFVKNGHAELVKDDSFVK